MSEYESVIENAEREAANGKYKEAYNTLARAMMIGGPADRECRYRRGLWAQRVAHHRLDTFRQGPHPDKTLIKAGCWLARSEAYLLSASEGDADPELQEKIASDLAHTKQQQDRFRQLCKESGFEIFSSRNEPAGQ